MWVIKSCLLILLFSNVYAWQTFFRGREFEGNIGRPYTENVITRKFPAQWFTQVLDHFNLSDSRTWQQRYYINEEYYDTVRGGPVFLMIGGEGKIHDEWMTNGAWIKYAERFHALLINLEHRYYGESRPTEDLTTENLQYLSSRQALMDTAAFIKAMNEKLPSDVKWIMFGGSYAGSLAAWMRIKYPSLVHGAISSSSPLLAEVDFHQYYRVVHKALNHYSSECATVMQYAVKQTNENIATVQKSFGLCDKIKKTNHEDVANFFETIASNIAGVVQFNNVNRFGKWHNLQKLTIDWLCTEMVKSPKAPMFTLGEVTKLIQRKKRENCLDHKYNDLIETLSSTSWGNSSCSSGMRQWTYQTCTEFGFFQSSSDPLSIFGDKFPVNFYIKQCQDIFGPKYSKGFIKKSVQETNEFYGGLGIRATNTVFVHGSIDPWHVLGVTNMTDKQTTAIFIKGTAHCADLYPESKQDPPALTNARKTVAKYIKTWLHA